MAGSTDYRDSYDKLYDSVVWTHKIQRTYLETLEFRRRLFMIIKLAFTSISGLATLVFAFLSEETGTIVSSFCTIGSLFFGEILDKVETSENIDKFRHSSEGLWLLKNKMLKTKDEIVSGKITDEIINERIDSYYSLFNNITACLPTIPDGFVKKASTKIKERKDEEIEQPLL